MKLISLLDSKAPFCTVINCRRAKLKPIALSRAAGEHGGKSSLTSIQVITVTYSDYAAALDSDHRLYT